MPSWQRWAMWAAVRAQIEPGSGSGNVVRGVFGNRRWIAPLVAAACLAVVAAVGFTAWQGSQPAGQPEIATTGAGPVAPVSGEPLDVPAPRPGTGAEGSGQLAPPPVAGGAPVRHQTRAVRPVRASRTGAVALPVPIADAERRYLDAISLLDKEFHRSLDDGSVRSAASRRPLDDLDANILSARSAVERNPDDPVAVSGMLSAYDEKVDALQRLVAMQARNDR